KGRDRSRQRRHLASFLKGRSDEQASRAPGSSPRLVDNPSYGGLGLAIWRAPWQEEGLRVHLLRCDRLASSRVSLRHRSAPPWSEDGPPGCSRTQNARKPARGKPERLNDTKETARGGDH